MDKEFALKLEEALESEKYIQGKYRLAKKVGDEIHFCLLGVACIVSGIKPEDVEDLEDIPEDYEKYSKVPKEYRGGTPYAVMLIELNDRGCDPMSFTEIAKVIRIDNGLQVG